MRPSTMYKVSTTIWWDTCWTQWDNGGAFVEHMPNERGTFVEHLWNITADFMH